ncbi:MAG TPA: protein-L-isoaspartate(D-aspartate) O-methyltransferase [Herbaspirillum sp.]|jgi:protein-L-isoaspartate(D-aspartate) O-methyltransferase|nr:protein-L-isoaspartate(D-aspartate) O-methyltransferase [Herbaspirillum sp.]
MTEKNKRFPLSLDSLAQKNPGKTPTRAVAKTATPQTATRNAASSAVSNSSRHATVATPQRARSDSHTSHTSSTTKAGGSSMVSDAVRKAMVARVAQLGVRDNKVLAALEAVPRHLFLEPAMASQAYIDASLPIGYHQTISQPYIVARMIEVMRDNHAGGELKRVLEIGTGCGYQAAVLSVLAGEVYSIERIKPLHELAKRNLRPMRIPNIRLHYGDGMLGLPQVAPFDGIILAAAGMEVPQALLDQLAIGGRLIAPVGGEHQDQVLLLIERIGKFEWSSVTLEGVRFVPLRPGVA